MVLQLNTWRRDGPELTTRRRDGPAAEHMEKR